MRAFSALCFVSLQLGVFWTTAFQVVVAQPATSPEQSSRQFSVPSPTDVAPAALNNEISPQLNRYLLGPGDTISVVVQRPPGPYRLGPGDNISVMVQRFPDLSFQAAINPEGNIIVPLIKTVSLQGLTLLEAQEKIRLLLNRYVVEPVVVLSLAGQRPDLSFQAVINPEGNILVPQVGTVSLQGLSVEEAQEKIRLALSRLLVDPIVVASLATPRPVQVTISGEVFRPGIYAMGSPTPRVADALLTSGGTTTIADLRQVQVRRRLVDGSVISQTVDLYTALQNGSSVPNFRLQDGDTIIVPRREIGTDDGYDRNLIARSTLAIPQIRVRVLNYAAGGIANQLLPNGSTFIDALGGINLDTANLRDIALVRFDPERGQAVTQRLDAKKALGGDMSQNVPLQDNDVIVVGRNLIGRITNALSTITQPFFNVQSFIRFFDFFTGGSK
ncbi:sugar ABC transporter substrate-binding protein [Nostoc sp. RF31YmG]|nr:sugar ABC transporter substrate-binding protein [Nostoc sp. RF31YmG]OUL25605.1 sugar ABC transporter substrate-binding protein [Nostoc sp. 106C]